MGRHKTNTSRDFFAYNKIENKSTCSICSTAIKGNHAANLERHLKRNHNNAFETVQQKKKLKLSKTEEPTPGSSRLEENLNKSVNSEFLKVKLNKETILKACVELITVNGCSFELLEYSGFQKILHPIVSAMGNNFSISAENIKLLIPETASKIVGKIRDILKKNMISLKIDTATCLNKSILGINAQVIVDDKINLFTLGMTELKGKNTGTYIKNTLEKIFKKYNIDVQQIYSVTTGNGADAPSFVNFLGEDIGDDHSLFETETKDNLEKGLLLNDKFSFGDLIGIKCVSQAFQLAIEDSIKVADLNVLISDARELTKKLRVPSLILKFKDLKIKRPILDCPTRWSSTYDMLKSLLECKEFISSLAKSDPDYNFSESKWVKLNLIVDTLQTLTEMDMKLQSEKLTLSDFYGVWIQCKLKLKNMKNAFAEILHNNLSIKESLLLKNESLLGSVYLDPRFQVLLTAPQKMQAVQHLKLVWNKLLLLEKPDTSSTCPTDVSPGEPDEPIDDLEEFLKSKDEAIAETNRLYSMPVDVEYLLKEFERTPRLDRKKCIIQFWNENKNKYPYLYKIAKVVLGVPATQISVERAVSGLKFILRDNRSSLNENTLEDVLLIRSNFHIF